MSSVEKTAVGAHVYEYNPRDEAYSFLTPSAQLDNVSSVALSSTAKPSPLSVKDESSSQNPFSAFYSHPMTRTSFEQQQSESKSRMNVYERDVEAGSSTLSTPTKEYLSDPARQKSAKNSLCAKQPQGCYPMRNLGKVQKLCVKILIAVSVLGTAIGIGVGISMAVGAGIWKSSNERRPIGHHAK